MTPEIPQRYLVFSGLVLITFFLGSACTREKNQKGSPSIFRYNEAKGISSLDPAFARNQTNIWPVTQLFNGLVQLDDQLRVQPAIARHWEISPDGLVYTFYLRQDVYFHDHPLFPGGKGRRVTARDFAYSLDRISKPSTRSPGAWIFRNLNRLPQNDSTGFIVISDSIFQIHIRQPFPAFLSLLTMPYASVIPEEIQKHYREDFRHNPVGTGPFRFKTWKEGEKLVLLRNPNYFECDSAGTRLPYIDGIAISFYADKQSEFLEFVKGRLDFLSGLHPSYKDELTTRTGQLQPKYQGRFQMISQPYLNTEYLGIRMEEKSNPGATQPLSLKKVRQAINFGFDRKKMMTFLRNNIGEPAFHGFVPLGMPFFDHSQVMGYSYQPEHTRRLLAEAGFPGGQGLPVITLTTTSGYLDLCEYIQQQLQESGFRIQIEVGTGGSFLDMVANGKLPFFRGSWIADYPDPENYLALFYSPNCSPNGPNYTRFSHPDFDRMYRESQLEQDSSRRARLYEKMDRLILEEAPVVPLYYDQVLRFTTTQVSGLASNPLNLLNIKYVKIQSKP
jgi:oligopeptide transport system substrate-binding protein